MPLTLDRCLRDALANRDTPVLSAPLQTPLLGEGVLSALHVQTTALRAMNLGRGDRVAYALPDSASTALLCLSLMCVGTAAPINPKLPQAEIEKTLRNLKVRSVVVSADQDSAAHRAARSLGLHTILFRSIPNSYAGHFELIAPSLRGEARDTQLPSENDVALVVQTSGTTGAQKIVPLAHRNLLSMMLANRERLGILPTDRGLGVMPLFHIHGLGAVISSLLGGSLIHILPEFTTDGFYQGLRDIEPTWYTAVPTIHQAVLRAAPNHVALVEKIARTRQLRFVRSGSAPMPLGVPEQLERVFNTTYVEASGATECSAYICSNAPESRRIGSVGKPMPGNEVLIVDPQGMPLGAHQEGELIARGPGVFGGYEGNPELTAQAFLSGYFRTGDLGFFDADGYFYLTGRLKEQINRAGMKVSPREVDDAIMTHPAVHLVATFAAPHPTLGEEVHAAVVLRPGHTLTSIALQRHLSTRIADYKIPRVVHFVDRIPTNTTGKIVRTKLAETLGVKTLDASEDRPSTAAPSAHTAPLSPTELSVAAIFSRILRREMDDIDLDFHAAGGDSMQAMSLSLSIEQHFSRAVPVSSLSSYSTIRRLAGLLDDDGWTTRPGAPVVLNAPGAESSPGPANAAETRNAPGAPISPAISDAIAQTRDPAATSSTAVPSAPESSSTAGEKPTLFCLPGIGGNVYCYAAVACRLATDQPVIGLPLPGTDGLEPPLASIPMIASRFVSEIRAVQSQGPYVICGYSFGGRVAFEVCRQLQAQGQRVARLILIDTAGPDWPKRYSLVRRLRVHARRLIANGPIRSVLTGWHRRTAKVGMTPTDLLEGLRLNDAPAERQAAQLQLIESAERASREWVPTPLNVPVTILRAAKSAWSDCDTSEPTMGWRPYVEGSLDVHVVPGTHGTLFHSPAVTGLALAISLSLDALSVVPQPSR